MRADGQAVSLVERCICNAGTDRRSSTEERDVLPQPLILTLQIDDTAQAFYEELRRRYFPRERNLIPAHLTLFHQLPDEERVMERLRDVAEGTMPFVLREPQAASIGRGVAVFFRSEELMRLHEELAVTFQSELIAQDRQKFRPHIVVQNKVDGAAAQGTLEELRKHPLMDAAARGVTVWRYLGGPWEWVVDLPLGGSG